MDDMTYNSNFSCLTCRHSDAAHGKTRCQAVNWSALGEIPCYCSGMNADDAPITVTPATPVVTDAMVDAARDAYRKRTGREAMRAAIAAALTAQEDQ